MAYGRAFHQGRGEHKTNGGESDIRLLVLRWGFFAFAAFIVLRLFTLQVLEAASYADAASGQYGFYKDLFPVRGQILVRDLKDGQLYPAATNMSLGLVFADPRSIKPEKIHETVMTLGTILSLSDADVIALEDKLSQPGLKYLPIAHKVPETQLAMIDAAQNEGKLYGIAFSRESYRTYPEIGFGGHVIGFVGSNDDGTVSGKYGIEGYFEKELAGTQGFLKSEQGVVGQFVAAGDLSKQAAVNGTDIVLTIDRNIQYTACKFLKEAVDTHTADGGSIVIMNPATGEILAMCGSPDFDPNRYGQVANINTFNNPATFDSYEPGSIFKAITMAAAIDAGKVTPDTTYTDTGEVTMDNYTIHNSENKVYGLQNMTQVLEESINTGVIFAMQQIGKDVFQKYVQDFGFGAYTSIELSKEVPGDISSLGKKGDIYSATASFGQGITATPLQMAVAYSAFANGGKLMQPYIVEEKRYADGRVEKTSPIAIRQVISEKTANLVSAMLISVVENGHGKKAAVQGYYVAGKTGTAQVAGSNGQYQANNTIGSFAGYGPVGNAKFVMVARMDHPRDVQWAESTAGPLFHDIASFLLQYFEVPPQR